VIAVIFEVWPGDGHRDAYLDIATDLRPELEKIDGFISVERFSSLVEDGKILSLSIWRDEDAVKAWREQFDHRAAQAKGRHELFANYRLRVAEVLRDYGPTARDEAPG
jgi:heme-degrading monooxygenase HmoA